MECDGKAHLSSASGFHVCAHIIYMHILQTHMQCVRSQTQKMNFYFIVLHVHRKQRGRHSKFLWEPVPFLKGYALKGIPNNKESQSYTHRRLVLKPKNGLLIWKKDNLCRLISFANRMSCWWKQ